MFYKEEYSLKLISQIGRDLIQMAEKAEGLEDWIERHNHVRLFADELYGDSDEAAMLSCSLTLHKEALSAH